MGISYRYTSDRSVAETHPTHHSARKRVPPIILSTIVRSTVTVRFGEGLPVELPTDLPVIGLILWNKNEPTKIAQIWEIGLHIRVAKEATSLWFLALL